MSEVREDVADVRRKIALDLAPITREIEAAERAASTPARKSYWRSLGELMKAPSFTAWAHHEFPQLEQELALKDDGPSRRRFLQLMGASIALAGFGAAGCRRPETKIHPYTKKPVGVIIGKGMYFATTFTGAGEPIGVLAETHEGRPTKIEGNPLHPNSRGGTDLFAQASILDLYDPDRSRLYRVGKQTMMRDAFVPQLDNLAKELRGSGGAGVAVLMRPTHSPAIEMVLEQMGKNLPQAQLFLYEPLRPQVAPRPVYDFTQARVIVSLDSDIFGQEDAGTRYRRQFIDGRRLENNAEMNQLYVIEPMLSQTGAIADHRLAMRGSEIGRFAEALLGALKGGGQISGWDEKASKWITVLAETLKGAGGNAIVVAGTRQGPALQALAHEINSALGSAGQLVQYAQPQQGGDIVELAQRIGRGEVKTLVILHANPVYDAPADLKFADLLNKVPLSIRLGLYDDETSELSTWHLPSTHYLESWGDARAFDGTISAIQPMIEPLFAGMSDLELLARLGVIGKSDPYELVQMSFARYAGKSDENAFAQFLQEGVFKGQAKLTNNPGVQRGQQQQAPVDPNAIEICFLPDATLLDGRFANNAWLQECPDPVTKLTWDNAALMSPALATRLGVEQEDIVRIELGGVGIEMPVFIMPGTVDNSISLPLGFGRWRGGVIAQNNGVNTYLLRTTQALGCALGATVSKSAGRYKLACTQEHFALDLEKHLATADDQAKTRAIIREGTLEHFKEDPGFAKKMGEHAPISLSIYSEPLMTGANQWAMVVDLHACVGCNACVVACQAENNVPVVGKDEVLRGREMHWLRLDRYFVGEDGGESVRTAFQPMMCQHCENAPCEPVCPVNATVHSPEGLNEMIYNRCIGTRYCSNNCPYKVRRFNYFDWNKGTLRADIEATRDEMIEPTPLEGWSQLQIMQPPMQEMLKMAQNPNVSTRMRGVMEKCTYCVQRLEMAKIEARSAVGQGNGNVEINGVADVRVPQGAVTTACAQACPTQAILFGDKSDQTSAFYKKWNAAKIENGGHPRSYQVLEHLNVEPRTHYLAKIRNLNPKLEEATPASTAH